MKRLAATIALSLVAWLAPFGVAPPPAHASCTTAGCPSPSPCSTSAGPCWRPTDGLGWLYQLKGANNTAGTACNFPSTGGLTVNIAAAPSSGGAAVQTEVL